MASKTAVLAVRIITDTRQGQKGLSNYGTSVEKLGKKLDQFTVPAAVALGLLLKIGSNAITAASDLEQSAGAIESVYGAYADTVKLFAA